VKKLFYRISLLVLPLICILLFIESRDRMLPSTDGSVARVKVAAELCPADYLFVGPSYCYNGIYIPAFDSLEQSAFILGVATAGPYYYEVLIDDYLKSCKVKPKTVCLSLNLATCSDVLDNWTAYPIHRYLNEPLSNELVFYRYTNFKDYILLMRKSIKKTFSAVFENKKELIAKRNKVEQYTSESRGFSGTDEIVNDSIIKANEHNYEKFKTTVFNNRKADHFIGLIKKYKDQNVNIVVFEIPTFKLKTYLTPQYLQDYNLFKHKLKELDINFVEDEKTVDDYRFFSSTDHMNSSGAIVFTRGLINKLELQERK
jgi:hypothetical protein